MIVTWPVGHAQFVRASPFLPRRRNVKEQSTLEAPKLYSLSAAGRELGGISHWTLRKHVAHGRIKAVKLGNRVFLTADEVSRICREGLPSIHQQEQAA